MYAFTNIAEYILNIKRAILIFHLIFLVIGGIAKVWTFGDLTGEWRSGNVLVVKLDCDLVLAKGGG